MLTGPSLDACVGLRRTVVEQLLRHGLQLGRCYECAARPVRTQSLRLSLSRRELLVLVPARRYAAASGGGLSGCRRFLRLASGRGLGKNRRRTDDERDKDKNE